MVIDIDNAAPGMKLIEDVFLPGGVTLLNSTTVLTEDAINKLKKHNIKRINVEGDTDEEAPVSEDDAYIEEGGERKDTVAETSGHEKDEKPSFPKITVQVEEDGFSAYLRIEPIGENNESITVEDLQQVLLDNNVIFGVDESLLEDSVRKWNETKNIVECEKIAKGIPPCPAKEGNLNIKVKHLKNSGDFDRVKNAQYCWELLKASIPIERVDKGTIIAEKDIKIPDVPGMKIFGEEVKSDEVEKVEVKIGENVEEDAENGVYKSLITGLTYYVEDTIGALPIDFNGLSELIISNDNLKADLIIHPAIENGEPSSEDSIKTLIKEKNINFGINTKLVSDIIEKVKNGVYPEQPVTIAQGILPVDGEDGKVEYLFRTASSLKPQVDEQGSVDFKHVSIIQSVKKGKKVARLTAPTKGNPGKDIFSKDIPCKEGTPATLPAGLNTMIDPDDKNALIAQKDGNVRLNGQLVEVFDGFIIKGDVDYSTGNIEYDKSVVVKGDIKSGFAVNCGGDLEVDGTIEDARLTVGGSVLCKYGFMGQGKGIIECKGDVNLNFMKNQTIRCYGNVNIAREALNSTIFASGIITVSGKSVSVAGGRLVAFDGIICNVIGNESGTRTILEVGVDFNILDELKKSEKDLAEFCENREKLMRTYEKLEHLLKLKKVLPQKQKLLFEKLGRAVNGFDKKIDEINERIKNLKNRMSDVGNPFIKIENSAMPGSHFKIAGRNHIVQKEIIGPKTVRFMNSEICVM